MEIILRDTRSGARRKTWRKFEKEKRETEKRILAREFPSAAASTIIDDETRPRPRKNRRRKGKAQKPEAAGAAPGAQTLRSPSVTPLSPATSTRSRFSPRLVSPHLATPRYRSWRTHVARTWNEDAPFARATSTRRCPWRRHSSLRYSGIPRDAKRDRWEERAREHRGSGKMARARAHTIISVIAGTCWRPGCGL